MLTLKNVYKVYENGTVAVRNVSAEFPSCGMVAIIGTSGCGKSTLLNLLSNNDIQSKGQRLYNGKDYLEYERAVLLKDFAIVHQDFKLIENLTVYQNIKIGYELSNNVIDNDFILQTAKKLDIENILDEKVYSLSGGQQQRVAIARAVVRQPKVIFADEPTGNLDSLNSENVYSILKELSKEILVVIVSHDIEVSKFADRIIEMDNGKILRDCAIEDYNQIQAESSTEKSLPNAEILNVDLYEKPKKKSIEKENKNKKPSKISSKSIFLSTKGKSKTRKKQGLSSNSIIGLTLAFNNKGIVKKIVLLIIAVFMLMLIFFTTTVVFSSQEAAFCNSMKNNKIPFVEMDIYSREFLFNTEHNNKVQEYLKNATGADAVPFSYTFLHRYLGDIEPADDVNISAEIEQMHLPSCHTVYVDDENELGLKIIKGRAPKYNVDGPDEIAISKTFYDYFMYVKRFKNYEEQIVDFGKRDLLGSYIEEFRFTITGVFDDLNEFGLKMDMENVDLYDYNHLVYTIIRPKAALTETIDLYSQAAKVSLYNISYGIGMTAGFYYMAPNNKSLRKYYYNCSKLQNELEPNEVYVSSMFASDYSMGMGKDLQVGDTIKFDFIERGFNLGGQFVKNMLHQNLQFIVKDIEDGLDGYVPIVMNEQVYNSLISPYFDGIQGFAINSKYISPKFIRNIRQYIYNEISPDIAEIVKNDWQHYQFSVDFKMAKYMGNEEYYNDVADIARFYIGVPLCIIATAVLVIIICVLMSDMVKEKGREILILRSLGTTYTGIWKIFGLVTIITIAVLLVLGCSLGIGLIYGLNVLWMYAGNYNYYLQIFYVSPLSIFTMLLAVTSICGFALWYSLHKYNGKNLRKLFQKQKK